MLTLEYHIPICQGVVTVLCCTLGEAQQSYVGLNSRHRNKVTTPKVPVNPVLFPPQFVHSSRQHHFIPRNCHRNNLQDVRSRNTSTFRLPSHPPRITSALTISTGQPITNAKAHSRRLQYCGITSTIPSASECQTNGETTGRGGAVYQVSGGTAHVHDIGGAIQSWNEHDRGGSCATDGKEGWHGFAAGYAREWEGGSVKKTQSTEGEWEIL